jgi:hypothetical protein
MIKGKIPRRPKRIDPNHELLEEIYFVAAEGVIKREHLSALHRILYLTAKFPRIISKENK